MTEEGGECGGEGGGRGWAVSERWIERGSGSETLDDAVVIARVPHIP